MRTQREQRTQRQAAPRQSQTQLTQRSNHMGVGVVVRVLCVLPVLCVLWSATS
jgi:hypothetical protein